MSFYTHLFQFLISQPSLQSFQIPFPSVLLQVWLVHQRKPIWLEIIHLNPPPLPSKAKKADGSQNTDLAYGPELCMVKEKLHCPQHQGPNWFCYLDPTNPREHIALGLEEVTLWAQKIVSIYLYGLHVQLSIFSKHDNGTDPDCIMPPDCLNISKLQHTPGRIRGQCNAPSLPPVHVHVGTPFLDQLSSSCNKRTWSSSISSESGSNSDLNSTLPVSIMEVLSQLH